MSDRDMFEDAFPQDKQVGGSHYKFFEIQPYEFISCLLYTSDAADE